MNDELGNFFPHAASTRSHYRSDPAGESVCILILDPVLGSRFSLAQAVSQPRHVVKTASTIVDAIAHLNQGNVSLVIAEECLAEGDGISFLIELRNRFPSTRRALVTASQGVSFIRDAIERGGLSFVLSKPWSPRSLSETIREVLGGDADFVGWAGALSRSVAEMQPTRQAVDHRQDTDRQNEILLRGLLAGLNSCEFASEVLELVHTELALPFRVRRWLWVDEQTRTATRIEGDWPVEGNISLSSLSPEEAKLLTKARRSLRITQLGEAPINDQADAEETLCLSLAIRDQDLRTITGLVFVDRSEATSLVSVLRELQAGLQMAFRRIKLAEARALAARRLARRVSEELRTPIGALTHAIDRLRGEAKRAGMPTECVDRVSSESERVARAVKHLEGEMMIDENGFSSTFS